MNDYEFPSEIELTKADFDITKLQNVIDTIQEKKLYNYYEKFSEITKKYFKEEDKKQAKIFWLLADACSLCLTCKYVDTPFAPMVVLLSKRSADIEDFTEKDIRFFSEIVETIDDLYLQSRLSDIIWSTDYIKHNKFAHLAVMSYIKIPIEKNNWNLNGERFIKRAIQISRSLKGKGKNYLDEIENKIILAFNDSKSSDNIFPLQLSNLMLELKFDSKKSFRIASKLEEIALSNNSFNNLYISIEYFEAASNWFLRSNNENQAYKLLQKQASIIENQSQNSNLGAFFNYQKALSILRKIPRKVRKSLNINQSIQRLEMKIEDSETQALDEMQTFTTPEVDVSEFVLQSKAIVSGKNKEDVLKIFSKIFPIMNIDEMGQLAINNIKKYPFTSLCLGTYFNSEGRMVSKSEGIDLKKPIEVSHPKVQDSIMTNHQILVQSIVISCLTPALQVIHIEHKFSENDFYILVKNSSLVPIDRQALFAQGLYAGYEYDYVSSLNILVPQLENLVRFHLKNKGEKTFIRDDEGIAIEMGLSSLVELDGMKDFFGKNLTFEIKALFCDPRGPNLRNLIAHGLLNYQSFYSIYSMYAWWFILKLVCITVK